MQFLIAFPRVPATSILHLQLHDGTGVAEREISKVQSCIVFVTEHEHDRCRILPWIHYRFDAFGFCRTGGTHVLILMR